MLSRVAKLEAQRAAPQSPIELAYGSMDAFAEKAEADIAAGKLDSRDFPIILNCLRKWHRDGLWAGWTRQSNRV
jgi:hypothetical protein